MANEILNNLFAKSDDPLINEFKAVESTIKSIPNSRAIKNLTLPSITKNSQNLNSQISSSRKAQSMRPNSRLKGVKDDMSLNRDIPSKHYLRQFDNLPLEHQNITSYDSTLQSRDKRRDSFFEEDSNSRLNISEILPNNIYPLVAKEKSGLISFNDFLGEKERDLSINEAITKTKTPEIGKQFKQENKDNTSNKKFNRQRISNM